MRRTNTRLVAVGSVLLLAAIAFFLFMLSIASKSTDPVELMRTVGSVSGCVGGLAIAMVVFGFIGKKSGAAAPVPARDNA
jgi:TRAP-type mannitol/chloroaromatic compound transport system permease large subunit